MFKKWTLDNYTMSKTLQASLYYFSYIFCSSPWLKVYSGLSTKLLLIAGVEGLKTTDYFLWHSLAHCFWDDLAFDVHLEYFTIQSRSVDFKEEAESFDILQRCLLMSFRQSDSCVACVAVSKSSFSQLMTDTVFTELSWEVKAALECY